MNIDVTVLWSTVTYQLHYMIVYYVDLTSLTRRVQMAGLVS